VEVASPFCGLRDRFAFSRSSLHLPQVCSLHLSKERSPGAHRRQADDRRYTRGGWPLAAYGFVVCLAQTAPLSCCTTQTPPSPSVAQELPSGMWPVIPCDGPSLRRRMGWSRSKTVIPFLRKAQHMKATRSHDSHDSQEHGFNSPASLHINPRQMVSAGQTSGEPGRCQSPTSSYRGTCSTYLLKMGTRGGALSVTVGSCRCKQEHGTRALSLLPLLYYSPAYDI
jgi:hypothetical protein